MSLPIIFEMSDYNYETLPLASNPGKKEKHLILYNVTSATYNGHNVMPLLKVTNPYKLKGLDCIEWHKIIE